MHNNYHFLKALSQELSPLLSGYRILSCYSQEKDELIIEIEQEDNSVFIRAHFTPSFSCLALSEQHKRARKNSIDLFRPLIGKTINSVHQHSFERAISLVLSDDRKLTFKLFGNRSNVVLFENDEVAEIFRSSLKQDYSLEWNALDRSIDLSHEAFIAAEGDPAKFCPTLGKPLKEYLWSKGFAEMENSYAYLLGFLNDLSLPPYYVTDQGDKIRLSLVEQGAILAQHNSAISALNEFFLTHQREGQLRTERRRAIDQIGRELERAIRYVDKNAEKLHALQHEDQYQQRADLIMANLHMFHDGRTTAIVDNFYDENRPVEIRIKPSVSPQKYAEQLYRKAKNQHIQIEQLEVNIGARRTDIRRLEALLDQVKVSQDIRELRNLVGKPKTGNKTQSSESLPYRLLEVEGYQLWIGKSAKGNDELLKRCHKDDLWLHAKDAAGSHVIIRQRPGSGVPSHVKERAAELAAYHSKRKNDTLCPVILTHRKYVRKRKGDPAGMVRVDREEEILLVPPRS